MNIVIDNTFMQVDGPGKTYMYDPTGAMVRTSYYSWWTHAGWGFDLLP